MKNAFLLITLLFVLILTPVSCFANPRYFGDTEIEYMKFSNDPAKLEGTVRFGVDSELGSGFYVHLRSVVDRINLKTSESTTRAGIDQGHLGFRQSNLDFRAGKQWVYLGKGLQADVNVNRVLQASATFPGSKLTTFISPDLKALDLHSATTGKINVGFSYKNKSKDAGSVSHNGADYSSSENNADRSWALYYDASLTGKLTLGGVYVLNDSGRHGFMTELKAGSYSLSYRNVQTDAIDSAWATSGVFADSRGFRARADWKISKYSILTIYRDMAKNHAGTLDKDYTYAGIASYF